MIKPTIGRIIFYTPSEKETGVNLPVFIQPAIIVWVHDYRRVNLCVFDANGNTYRALGVTVIQEGDPKPEAGRFCEFEDKHQ